MLAIFLSCVAFGYSQPQAPGCPQVTCVMFCANGIKKDANGCNTCSCAPSSGQGVVANFDCSQAPGWGWCQAYFQCVNPSVTPCPGGITGTPGAGAVGAMPNPSVQPSAQVSLNMNLANLPASFSNADSHGCPSSFPWCASVQSCAAPSACGGAAPLSAPSVSAGFAQPSSYATPSSFGSLSLSFGSSAEAPSSAAVSVSSAAPKALNCEKKSCKACRAHLGCNWHTTGQCLPYCRPDGTCLTVGQTCPAKPKKIKAVSQAD